MTQFIDNRSGLIPSLDFSPVSLDLIESTVVARFKATVERYPNKIAITFDQKTLTFSELDTRSNSLAHSVIGRLGSGKDPVAILVNHNIDGIVALLAVMKTGRPFIAMDTSFPAERVREILLDASAAMLLTNKQNLSFGQEILNGIETVAVLNGDDVDYSTQRDDVLVDIHPEDPLLIAYTSGSTGRPKGVIWGHQQMLANYIPLINEWYVTSLDKFTLLSSLSMGASWTSIYVPFLSGATICMYDIKLNGIASFSDWLLSQEPTIFRSTKPVFKAIFSEIPSTVIFPSLRLVAMGGQSVTSQDVALCRQHTLPTCIFANHFASTETSVLAHYYVGYDTPLESDALPLGHPFGSKEVFIVDESGQVIPNGQKGEIVVRSKYLPKGYLNHPELNERKFKTDPQDPEYIFYFSGDAGRWNDAGLLEHLGRKDNVVKIRGYRIDLAEIESAICEMPNVQDAVVIARIHQSGSDNKQLFAYVVPATDSQLTARDLQISLAKKLPGYMVPPFITFMEKLPLNSSGKVDRLTLPDAPNRQELLADDQPVSQEEERLLAIWRKIFNLELISVHDNFFGLGGDSLMAMNLLLSIEKEFSRKIPLAIISKASTIRQQAEILLNKDALDVVPVVIPIQTNGNRNPIYCIGGKGGNPVRFHHLLRYLAEDQPVYFLRSRGFGVSEHIETTIEAIASDYLLEIKRIQQTGPYYFLGESGGGLVAYEMAQQLQRQGQETALVGMLDTYLSDMKGGKVSLPANLVMLSQKHVQTLISGGITGISTYLRYYIDLWKFKASESRYERRKKKALSQHGDTSDLYEKVERANITASRAYKPKPYSGRVVMFSAQRQLRLEGNKPDHGWAEVGIGELIIHSLDCYHGNILFEPFVQQVAGKVNQYLNSPVNGSA